MTVTVTAGEPAVCFGTVLHHRHGPAEHRFTYPVTMVWLDPDDPDSLCRNHPLWSAQRPSPVRIRPRDYHDGSGRPLGPAIRHLTAGAIGRRPTGPIRMLTQPRTWGWLFNPITIYLIWDRDLGTRDDEQHPVAAVLEVTNTPWKERHHYAVALDDTGAAEPFGKVLHVSPFLDEDYRYQLRFSEAADSPRSAGRRLTVDLDVVGDRVATRSEPGPRIQPPNTGGGDVESLQAQPVLTTRLVLDRHGATRRTMTTAILRTPLATHRVSAGIHRQAASLWRKRVPFVAHPKRRR